MTTKRTKRPSELRLIALMLRTDSETSPAIRDSSCAPDRLATPAPETVTELNLHFATLAELVDDLESSISDPKATAEML